MQRRILLVAAALLLGMTVSVTAAELHTAVDSADVARVEALLDENPDLLTERNEAGEPPLHRAATSGNIEIINLLLDRGAQIDAGDNEGTTATQLAALNGHLEALKLLQKQGGDIESGDDFGMTALHWAVARQHVEVVKYLLSQDVPLEIRGGRFLSTPLIFAASAGHQEITDLLIEAGADVNTINEGGYTMLHMAAMGGLTDVAQRLIDDGIAVDVESPNGQTPFFLASQRGQVEMMQWLAEHGADNLHKDTTGSTALMTAIRGGSVEAVQYLLDHGDNVSATTNEGEGVLDMAVWGGNIALIELLVSKGADLNAVNVHGSTLISTASFRSDSAFFSRLIELGADVQVETFDGGNLLHNSARNGNMAVINILMENGVDPNHADARGESPLHHAVRRGQTECGALLAAHTTNLDMKETEFGYTPLHVATIKGMYSMAETLLDAGAGFNTEDNQGRTPLALAKQYGHTDLIDLLVSRGATSDAQDKGLYTGEALSQELGAKDAHVWYLGHSGWAIKTAGCLLVFDYFNDGEAPASPCLANGHIDPTEIADLDVYVFSSHEHGDHYDRGIFDWMDDVRNITYILGHEPSGTPEYTYIAPRGKQTVGKLEVWTIVSTDLGVGYLVEVDDLCIFHAGDHANQLRDLSGPYHLEIDYLAENAPPVDLAFLPITGCSIGDRVAVQLGVDYALEKLSPAAMFPMHGGGSEYNYRAYAGEAAEKGITTNIKCAAHKGDRFSFKNNKQL